VRKRTAQSFRLRLALDAGALHSVAVVGRHKGGRLVLVAMAEPVDLHIVVKKWARVHMEFYLLELSGMPSTDGPIFVLAVVQIVVVVIVVAEM